MSWPALEVSLNSRYRLLDLRLKIRSTALAMPTKAAAGMRLGADRLGAFEAVPFVPGFG